MLTRMEEVRAQVAERDELIEIMEELSGRAKLSDLGDRLAAHPKAKKNPHFRDRIRATAYEHPGQYISCGNGFYALNYAVA